ncbi:hypothetical protein LMxysn_0096 [Listeria monocytogenes]|nr:hypothetical protein LMxysn_0096 [Listeria monocytogenes]
MNPEDYTVITNEDLNKKINNAWQDGVYYLNGNKNEGLELYKAKNGDDYPRTILYKAYGEFYIASEAAEQPNQQQ